MTESSTYLGVTSTVLAVITHYRYERWLAKSIESLLDQTRRPEAIVVLDDASPEPPIDIVKRYPQVALFRAAENAGPYLMLQAVFEAANYDSFLLQDADDWSSENRLAILLAAAEAKRAEMVGCQISSVFEDGLGPEAPFTVPEDPLSATLEHPTLHSLSMPTSLIAKALIQRTGGLATGLRFGADSEFTRRAIFTGRVINVPETCYFRRVHLQAATRTPDTGYGSPLRLSIQALVQERARFNVAQVLSAKPPNLAPLAFKGSAKLHHLTGPPISGL